MNNQIALAFEKWGKALKALEAAVHAPMQENRLNIDGCIQRFEFSIELSWLSLKRILASKGEEVIYPKDILRAAYRGSLIDDEKVWLQMLHDRNQTSHTYNEQLADTIYKNITHDYFPVLKKTYEKLAKHYNVQSVV